MLYRNSQEISIHKTQMIIIVCIEGIVIDLQTITVMRKTKSLR
jgi:hypothetical protein